MIRSTRPALSARALAALAFATLLGGAPTVAGARPLTLRQAVGLALRNDSLMQQARARLAGAEARRKQARGRMLPSLDAQGNLSYWDSALEVKLDPSSAQAMRIRDQLTTQLSLTISQPIAGQLLEAYHLTNSEQEAVAHDTEQTRLAVAFGAAEAYIRLQQASAGAEITRTAVEQVRAQLDQAQAFYRAGVIGRDDLLNVEVAQARAEAKQLRSQGLVAVARTLLLEITGWPVEVPLELAEHFGEPPTALPCALDACVERALRQRADLKGVVARIGAAEAYRDLTWWNLAPQLTALGSYQNMQGQSVFMPKNAFFIGGMASWNLWGWGRTAYEIKEADQKVVEGRSGLALLRRAVRLEVQQSHVALDVAGRMLAVAQRAVAQAQEAYRIVSAKYAAQASTTKDLLDAQLALTRAELLRSNALYGWYLARAALARALGEPPPTVLTSGVSMTQTMRWRRLAPLVATALLGLGACRQGDHAIQLPAQDPKSSAGTSATDPAAAGEPHAPSTALAPEQPTPGAPDDLRASGRGGSAGGLIFNGNTEAFRRSTLAPQVSGVVARVLPREGEQVRRGAVLVVIEPATFALRLRGAEAARAVARAQRDAVTVEWRKLSQLLKARAVPPSQYDTVNAQLHTAEAAVAQADVGVALAQHDLTNTVVRAPFDAVVTRRLIDPGEYASVMPSTPLLTVEEIDTLELRVQVPETAMAQVRVGTPIEARFTAIGRSVSARIARVVPALDPATRSLSAIAELPNADQGLRPGMFAEVRVLATPAPGAP